MTRAWRVPVLLAVSSLTASLNAAEEGVRDPAQVARRILTEEQRQGYVNRRVFGVVRGLGALVEDMKSNGLLEEAQGEQLLELAGKLGAVNEAHVLQAAEHLRLARQQEARRRDKLGEADAEVETIIRELKELLRWVKALETSELLRRELREIIREEEGLLAQTRDLGKQLFEGTLDDPTALDDLATSQRLVAQRVGRLNEPLAEALGDAPTEEERARIEQAKGLFEEKAVDARLHSASQNIESEEMVRAFLDEKEALEALREIERVLDPMAGERLLRDTREELARILREETELRELVEQAPGDQFRETAEELGGEQRELGTALQNVDRSLLEPSADTTTTSSPTSPDAGSPPEAGSPAETSNPIDAAQTSMARAEAGIAARQQQGTVSAQKSAEAALQQAIDRLDEQLMALSGTESDFSAPLGDLQALADSIGELEQAQRELRDSTQSQAARGQSVEPLAGPQQSLASRTANLAAQLPLPSVQQPLGQALQAMSQAGSSLDSNQPASAVPAQNQALDALAQAQQAAQDLMGSPMSPMAASPMSPQAAAAMAAAQSMLAQQLGLMNSTQQAAPGALPQLGPPQASLAGQAQSLSQTPMMGPGFSQAAQHMQSAAQALGAQSQGQALGAQQQAIASLLGAMGQGMGQGMGMGQGQGQGQGQGMGQGQGVASTGTSMPGSNPGFDPQGGDRIFQKTAPMGQAAAEDRATWTYLGAKNHPALSEKFIRELPVEHREMLKAYYEALSRGRP